MPYTPTELIYMTDMHQHEAQAKVVDIINWQDGCLAVILDQTIFYPQGGGQPYDIGFIKTSSTNFKVEEVRFKDGIVYHIGSLINGELRKGDSVFLSVDEARRAYNSKNHTAGHVIDIAMSNVGMKLTPGRGYHFPEGAYVEYLGPLDEQERERLFPILQKEVDAIIAQKLPVSVQMVSAEQLQEMAQFVPDYIPKDKPSRVMIIKGYYAIPCGGTHVANVQEIGSLKIEKIKNKKGNVRISYSIQ